MTDFHPHSRWVPLLAACRTARCVHGWQGWERDGAGRRRGPAVAPGGAVSVGGLLMALARTWAVALNGIAGHLVAVEADLAAGSPGTMVIGMGDAAVTQARDRVPATYLYMDEFQRAISTIDPESMLTEARGSGLGLTRAHQHLNNYSLLKCMRLSWRMHERRSSSDYC